VATAAGRASGGVLRDAAITVASRLVLAVLIFGSDIVLARLLGPAAKGRFALVLLYSQLAALVLGWGMDQAIAVIGGRDLPSARKAFANAIVWTAVVGGFGLVLSLWAYGVTVPGPPEGPLATLLPNLSDQQFLFAAIAIPGELFFALALFALLGRRLVAAYAAIRVLRRLVLLILVVAVAAAARLSLDVALTLNVITLAVTAVAIGLVARSNGFLGWRPSAPVLREELEFGSRAVPGALAERLQFRVDAFVVNAVVGVRATGVYSVTSGLAETLWYIPNALGVVMFSRAVGARRDASRVAAALTRATVAVTLVAAVPAFILGPRVVRAVYGRQFVDAGVALRYILPGVVAYSIVAILTRYLSGRGRPGTTTLILLAGLAANVVANLALVPRLGINGAALSSSLSYGLTALLALVAFMRVSGRGLVETLVIRPTDIAAGVATARALLAGGPRGRGMAPQPAATAAELAAETEAAELIVAEHEPGAEG
jgi:O-antigen/teichoic acid export membrane protein